jgi:hypothetical protein
LQPNAACGLAPLIRVFSQGYFWKSRKQPLEYFTGSLPLMEVAYNPASEEGPDPCGSAKGLQHFLRAMRVLSFLRKANPHWTEFISQAAATRRPGGSSILTTQGCYRVAA